MQIDQTWSDLNINILYIVELLIVKNPNKNTGSKGRKGYFFIKADVEQSQLIARNLKTGDMHSQEFSSSYYLV